MKTRHLIFPHIPKTAGTSVRRNVRRAFQRVTGGCVDIGVYDIAAGDWTSTEAFATCAIPPAWDFIYGHATLAQFLRNPALDPADAGITCLSFLRDPVDRCLSVYNYIATTPSHRLHAACTAAEPMAFFRRIAERDVNVQHRYLSCGPALAWSFLVAPSDRVGPTCAEAFAQVGGRDLGADFFDRRFNVTADYATIGSAHRLTREMLGPAEIEAVYARHDLDRRLFDIVQAAGVLRRNPVQDL